MCSICGATPCYGICPSQDQFGGDQRAEDDYYEATYDQYAEERAEAAREAMMENEHGHWDLSEDEVNSVPATIPPAPRSSDNILF